MKIQADCNAQPPARRALLALALGAMAVLAGAGCAGTKIEGSPASWRVTPMADADVMPVLSGESVSRRTRVVVMQPQEAATARGMGLQDVAVSALEAQLGEGGIEVVDRRLAGRLDQELKLVEVKGSASYGGPDVADFAVVMVMGNATWGSDYIEASRYKDKDGKVQITPASYAYSSRSPITVRIYELPSLRMVQSFSSVGTYGLYDQKSAANPSQAVSMLRSATEAGVQGKKADILNEFSPKGYVSERRVKGDVSIFRVLLGKQTGAKTGDNVEIVTLQKSKDGLTGKSNLDPLKVASGRISDVVGEGASWVIVSDEKAAAAVRRGDIVKVRHAKGLFN